MSASPLISRDSSARDLSARGSVLRSNQRVNALQQLASDPKFRKYTASLDKCLGSFDNVHEWADCIAFLKQLLKTFESYIQFKEIPRKLTVAKRLSQCLNPALPAGVHQKALQVYTHILSVLGTEGLQRDLAVWSSGLFPFFEYASTSVKPILLDIYETYYLPLQGGLRPLMRSFIIALLTGLEEETGEYFEQVLKLLDRLSGTVSPVFFFQNIWVIMLTTSSSRGTALTYLARRLPKFTPAEDITVVIGNDVGLMMRAFAAALEDENLLVRRSALDLLVESVRLDSTIGRAQQDAQVILMRAATGVVLRRDLTLNRRLYKWLCGTDEKSDTQSSYFKTHALSLLLSTLKDDMFHPSEEYAESRPFKIFISLLDKYEIGGPVTEALILDAFSAVKQLIAVNPAATDELLLTAGTLYEAVEPHVIWRRLLPAIVTEIHEHSETCEAIRLTIFILEHFKPQDDEIQNLHLPIVFAALVDIAKMHVKSFANETSSESLLSLLEQLFQQITIESLQERILPPTLQLDNNIRGYSFACRFYSIEPIVDYDQNAYMKETCLSSTIQDLLDALSSLGQSLVAGELSAKGKIVYAGLLSFTTELVEEESECQIQNINWIPEEWLKTSLEAIASKHTTFAIVDRIVTIIVSLQGAKLILPRPLLSQREDISICVTKLFGYLRPDSTSYHMRAVSLLWLLEESTGQRHVEAIISREMNSEQIQEVKCAYESFGTLWRLTEDNHLPGSRLKIPLMIVLESLKSDDPSLQRVGETWMRCSLKSYLRVLDPILFDLLDPTIIYESNLIEKEERLLPSYRYLRPFDQRFIRHLLETLLSVVRFGGQGFVKTARGALVRRSHHEGLVSRLGIDSPDDLNYLDLLTNILTRLVLSEPRDSLYAKMINHNALIQSSAIDLLQALVSRGEIDRTLLESLQCAATNKLFFCIHVERLDIQNKLLHLLHSLLSAANGPTAMLMNRTFTSEDDDESATESASSSLITQTLVDGISIPTNRPVLQHWLDFILMAVPQFKPMTQSLIFPLNECVLHQLRLGLEDLRKARGQSDLDSDVKSTTNDAEFIMLLNALERLAQLSLADPIPFSVNDDDQDPQEKQPMEASGLISLMTNVFSADNSTEVPENVLTARSPAYRLLHDSVYVLLTLWSSFEWHESHEWSSKDESISLFYNRTRTRCRRVLEHLFRGHTFEVFEAVVDCWSEWPEDEIASRSDAFKIVDILASSAQSVVHMLAESITLRNSSNTERSRKQTLNPSISQLTLFDFMEQYSSRLEVPVAGQVWGRFMQMCKDLAAPTREMRLYTYPLTRCFCVLADKISQGALLEDKRQRKDFQDTFSRLLDACVTSLGRADSTTWQREKKENLSQNGTEHKFLSDLKLDEKANGSSVSLHESLKSPLPGNTVQQNIPVLAISEFLATSAIPNLKRYLVDSDKIVNSCSNIVYYVVTPALKGRTRPMEVNDILTKVLEALTKINGVTKTWRATVADLLNDNRVFNSSPDMASSWNPVVQAYFDSDKTVFQELLSKVAIGPSANIFANREYEMLLRSLNIRRLSYALFTGTKNQFLTHLPVIQERLVDILKNVTAPIVQSEVYLCIRVLLCRLSPHNLTSFWPVLLTELMRVFDQLMTSTLPPDGSDELQLVLAAARCLDLLLVLQTEEFQIHQWIFITDTVDAVYRSDDWFPEAMMDQLAEIVGNLPVPEGGDGGSLINIDHISSSQKRSLKRPMLASIRQIESMRDLLPFFGHVSISTFEGVYASGGNVDWEAIEAGLLGDVFDGR